MYSVKSYWFELLGISICSCFLSAGGTMAGVDVCTGLLPDVIPEPRARSLPMDTYSDCNPSHEQQIRNPGIRPVEHLRVSDG